MKYETKGEIVSAGVRLTAEGGIASKFTNNTASVIPHGTCVAVSTLATRSIIPQTTEFDGIGFAYGDIAAGAEGWVVTCGVAEALFENGNAPQLGYWCKAAPTDGRIVAAASPTGVSAVASSEHFREVGHCLEGKSAGTDVRAFIVVHPL